MNKFLRFCLLTLSIFSTSIIAAATHETVDLGLPSGTLWATENINTTDCLYGWGATTGATKYADVNSNTPYVTVTRSDGENGVSAVSKYTASDGLTTLEQKDDAAYTTWGTGWRMPTKDEFQELIDNCTFIQVSEVI